MFVVLGVLGMVFYCVIILVSDVISSLFEVRMVRSLMLFMVFCYYVLCSLFIIGLFVIMISSMLRNGVIRIVMVCVKMISCMCELGVKVMMVRLKVSMKFIRVLVCR